MQKLRIDAKPGLKLFFNNLYCIAHMLEETKWSTVVRPYEWTYVHTSSAIGIGFSNVAWTTAMSKSIFVIPAPTVTEKAFARAMSLHTYRWLLVTVSTHTEPAAHGLGLHELLYWQSAPVKGGTQAQLKLPLELVQFPSNKQGSAINKQTLTMNKRKLVQLCYIPLQALN